ncbi:hypothetical protein DAPPUDRAFT_308750 [Daphnia pulex]|uniref:Protein kinase domain-containing protein n=1 Tax=Daphnia pulex TaxID=6669 RepID=E9H974_DAPPU|nr:hypothetical protein DAPPUDRAFT_308750 [Daphnia pulex]|eukprot:EFX71752.1 hypothetical protein DAPPUDRAFT_308750 [Daphnia pulex]
MSCHLCISVTAFSKEHTEIYIDSINKMILQPKTTSTHRCLYTAFEIFRGAPSITIDKIIKLGEGSLGTVYRRKRKGIPVAVKEIKLQNMDTKFFQREEKENMK